MGRSSRQAQVQQAPRILQLPGEVFSPQRCSPPVSHLSYESPDPQTFPEYPALTRSITKLRIFVSNVTILTACPAPAPRPFATCCGATPSSLHIAISPGCHRARPDWLPDAVAALNILTLKTLTNRLNILSRGSESYVLTILFIYSRLNFVRLLL